MSLFFPYHTMFSNQNIKNREPSGNKADFILVLLTVQAKTFFSQLFILSVYKICHHCIFFYVIFSVLHMITHTIIVSVFVFFFKQGHNLIATGFSLWPNDSLLPGSLLIINLLDFPRASSTLSVYYMIKETAWLYEHLHLIGCR